MAYKYPEYIDQIEGCPPADYDNKDMTVYRWVHEHMGHPNDFLPVAIISPERINDSMDPRRKCAGYGLSLYDTLANARKQYDTIVADHRRRVKQVGEYIAEARISKADGVISLVNRKTGHLTFHEYDGVDLKAKFEIKGRASYG